MTYTFPQCARSPSSFSLSFSWGPFKVTALCSSCVQDWRRRCWCVAAILYCAYFFSLERRKYVRSSLKGLIACCVLCTPRRSLPTGGHGNIQHAGLATHLWREHLLCLLLCTCLSDNVQEAVPLLLSLSPSFSSFFLFLSLSSSSSFSFIQETPSPVQGMRVGLNLRRSDRRCLA
jgi:hypothetical protein